MHGIVHKLLLTGFKKNYNFIISIFFSAIENEDLKSKYVLLQHEWRDQQNTIGRLEIQGTKLRSQLKHQAQFCSKAGSILGYCLWKSVQLPEIIQIILKEVNKLNRI